MPAGRSTSRHGSSGGSYSMRLAAVAVGGQRRVLEPGENIAVLVEQHDFGIHEPTRIELLIVVHVDVEDAVREGAVTSNE